MPKGFSGAIQNILNYFLDEPSRKPVEFIPNPMTHTEILHILSLFQSGKKDVATDLE